MYQDGHLHKTSNAAAAYDFLSRANPFRQGHGWSTHRELMGHDKVDTFITSKKSNAAADERPVTSKHRALEQTIVCIESNIII